MKTFPLLLAAAGLIAVGSAFAHNHNAENTEHAEHGKMSDAKMQAHHADMMQEILKGAWRSDANKARDMYRHPAETLAFFDVSPHSTVLEIWPGGGWYAEILVPYASKHGSYTGAINDPLKMTSERSKEYYAKQNQALRQKFTDNPAVFGKAQLIEFDPANPVLGMDGSVDTVLTFRNVHNWVGAGSEAAMFKGFFDVLAPGGVLGVVEHRAAAGKTLEEVKESGYLPEDYVIGLATAAGFVLEEKSEINANPADTKDHPNGVWTLPPVNQHDEADKAKYAAIGESDRMTLRFVKPKIETAAQ